MWKPLIIEGESDPEKRSCYDCKWCQAAISWWCINKEAVKIRNTRIPGIIHCPYWESAKYKKEINILERMFGDYIKIKGR